MVCASSDILNWHKTALWYLDKKYHKNWKSLQQYLNIWKQFPNTISEPSPLLNYHFLPLNPFRSFNYSRAKTFFNELVITHSTMHRLVCKQRESCKCYKRRSPGQHLYCRLIRLCVCSGGTFVWIQTWCILQWERMVYFIAAYTVKGYASPQRSFFPPIYSQYILF